MNANKRLKLVGERCHFRHLTMNISARNHRLQNRYKVSPPHDNCGDHFEIKHMLNALPCCFNDKKGIGNILYDYGIGN